jgi:hypothetical protein
MNCFSYWFSPDITIENFQTYRAQYTVNSSSTDADSTVQFRLRVNQKGSWQAWDRVVVSNNNQAPPPMRNYSVIFDPNVTGTEDDTTVFSFDIMSFDPNDDLYSGIYLESMALQEVIIRP